MKLLIFEDVSFHSDNTNILHHFNLSFNDLKALMNLTLCITYYHRCVSNIHEANIVNLNKYVEYDFNSESKF